MRHKSFPANGGPSPRPDAIRSASRKRAGRTLCTSKRLRGAERVRSGDEGEASGICREARKAGPASGVWGLAAVLLVGVGPSCKKQDEPAASDKPTCLDTDLECVCEAGGAQACAELARAAARGDTEPPNAPKAADLFESACEGGQPDACADLGMAFLAGNGRPRDAERALGLFRKACDAGSAAGCTNLGGLYATGLGGLVPNLAEAAQLFARACGQSYAPACRNLGDLHRRGAGVEKSAAKALELHRKACRGRDGESCMTVWHAARAPGVADKTRVSLLGEACDGGHAEACRGLSDAVRQGRGLRKDADRAARLAERSCELGSAAGCTDFGLQLDRSGQKKRAQSLYERACQGGDSRGCVQRGLGLVHKEPIKARALFERACQASDAAGCRNLAKMRSEGKGEADLREAAKAYEAACKAGDGLACAQAGALYAQGGGRIDRDMDKAVKLFRRACAAEEAEGCANLATALLEGDGAARDPAQAAKVLDKACQAKLGRACARLGVLYDQAVGVERSRKRALELFRRACDLDDGHGCTFLGANARVDGAKDDARRLLKKGCKLGHAEGCKQLEKLK